MTRRSLRIIGCLFLMLCAGMARAATCDAVIVRDTAGGEAFMAKELASGRCYAADVDTVTKGTLLNGSSDAPLAPGCYRLHVPLAMAPLANLRISEITVTLTAGGASRAVKILHFPQPDTFTDTTVDFTVETEQHVPYTVQWAITGLLAEKLRQHTKEGPAGPDPDDNDEIANLANAPKPADDGTILCKELPKITYRLAALKPCIETLSPLTIEVATDKIIYQPGERGAATVTVKNNAGTPVKAALTIELRAGVQTRREVAATALDIPAGESRQWSGPFALDGLYWGADIHAVATIANAPPAEGQAVFAVAKNIWETAIFAGTNYTVRFRDRALAETAIERLRADGYTGFESGFWAPDDFGDFTPDTELFFGGHLCYPGSISAMKNYLEFAHQRGMAGTIYSLITACSGPPAYELLRKHPDWFAAGEFFSDWLEHWPLMENLKIPPMSVWPYTSIAWGKSDGLLRVHARETIDAHHAFGWDGTRYDVYDCTSDWEIQATQLIRQLVEKEAPAYQFGYNTEVSDKVKPESYRIMLGNGGMFMHEAPRMIADHAYLFSKYLRDALDWREVVWQYGGQYGICYDPPTTYTGLEPYDPNGVYGTKLDAMYICALMLAVGAHPFYGLMEREEGQFPTFALRYAEFLWNNKMRPLKDATAVVSFGANVELIEWARLARRLDLDGNRHRLVLHLINPPARDAAHDLAQKTRPPLRDVPMTLALPDGARVDGIWALSPLPEARQHAVPYQANGKIVALTMPETRFWTVLVVEYTALKGIE